MKNIFKLNLQGRKKRSKKNTHLPDPDSAQILEVHLVKLKEANQIVQDVYRNRSEGFQLHHDMEICETNIATASVYLLAACGDLELKLHKLKSDKK
ncbi:MAG: hypothetical protein AB2795_20905 [Candidatus Thiodiazotropha endolucinida]